MASLFSPLTLQSGATLKNCFMLAPLTNLQSHADGVLSDEEFRWLTLRAEGGFGHTMTCAASVQEEGVGFPGQLGCHDDKHLPGLTRLAAGIKAHGSHAVVQLHNSGMRAMQAHGSHGAGQTGSVTSARAPMCPSDNEEFGAKAMSLDEVKHARDCFVAAAQRAGKAGFDGAELHGAHGYLICQFLSAEINKREDEYGGSPENRARFLLECVDGARAATKPGFSLGVRLSPERFGIDLMEMRDLARLMMREGKIDYLDLSLWDVFKEPQEEQWRGKPLAQYFTELERGSVRLGAAGKLSTAAAVSRCLDIGFDSVIIGRGAILHHDFPERVRADANFTPAALPVSADYLHAEGLSEVFVNYMRTWKGFVAEAA
ncbi:MAG TPA: NADH:flavin oxidoreductase [Hyphomonadaceae bacterium]|nr:NADH:flavin oxidoreductase [Hyphomonadaceae bacterium]